MHMEVELEVLAATRKFVENLLQIRRQDLERKKNTLSSTCCPNKKRSLLDFKEFKGLI
jgi:hypothetical protein